MTEYRIKWEIDVEASSPEDAAKEAFKHMQRQGTVFEVSSMEWVEDEGCYRYVTRKVDLLDRG
jgi:hypothetical protein